MTYQRRRFDYETNELLEDWTNRGPETVPCFVRDGLMGTLPTVEVSMTVSHPKLGRMEYRVVD